MDTQKVELSDTELSCEELDRVSGGDMGGVMGGAGPMGIMNEIMQMVQQQMVQGQQRG
jgi:hypothetical protein